MNDTTQTEPVGTALTVADRARLAVGTSEHEARLIELAKTAKNITAITNKDGYEEAHAQRMVLKKTRIAIAACSKDARDDAQAFAKAVIAEERRLIGIISPQEERLEGLQKAWDDAIEAEKQRKIAEEQARVQAIKEAIETLRRHPLDAVGKDAATIRVFIESCEETPIDEAVYGEHAAYAAIVKAESLAALQNLLSVAVQQEAEQARIEQERRELEELRAAARRDEQARAEQERVRREQEAANLRTEREDAQRREREAQEQLRRQAEESARLTRELETLRQANADRLAAEQRAEQARLAAEAEAVRQQEIDAANLQAQSVAIDEGEDRIAETEPATVTPQPVEAIERPSDAEIIEVIADHFDVSPAVASDWILAVQFHHPAPQAILRAA